MSVVALVVASIALVIPALTIPGSPVQLGSLLGGDPAGPEDLVVQAAHFEAELVDAAAAFLLPMGADVRFPNDLYRADLDGYCDLDARAGLNAIGLAANPYIALHLSNTHISSETAALHVTSLRFRVTEILDVTPSIALLCPTGGDRTEVINARMSTDAPRVGDEVRVYSYAEPVLWDELGELDRSAGPPAYTVEPGQTVTLIVGVKSLRAAVRGQIVATVTNGVGQSQEVTLTERLGPISVGAIDRALTEVYGGGGGVLYCAERSEHGDEGQAQPCAPARGSTIMELVDE